MDTSRKCRVVVEVAHVGVVAAAVGVRIAVEVVMVDIVAVDLNVRAAQHFRSDQSTGRQPIKRTKQNQARQSKGSNEAYGDQTTIRHKHTTAIQYKVKSETDIWLKIRHPKCASTLLPL